MSESKFNPSQQVERIREILVGRELGRVENRLSRLESNQTAQTTFQAPPVSQAAHSSLENAQQMLLRETRELKQHIREEAIARQQQVSQLAKQISSSKSRPLNQGLIEKQMSERMETLAAEMTARIDARTREILHHLQNEILQWKNQMDRDLQSIRDVKVDRKEVTSRFARMASAAMGDEEEIEIPEGFLL